MGRLDLNASPWHGALKGAEAGAEKMAHKVKHQISHVLIGAFGVHQLIQFTEKTVEAGHKIEEMAEKFNLTTDEVQLLQKEADATGRPFEELVKDADTLEGILSKIHGGPVLFSREQVENLERMHQIIQGFKESLQERLVEIISGHDESPELTDRQDKFLEKDAAKKRARDPRARAQAHMAMMDRVMEMDKKAKEFREKAHLSAISDEAELSELLKKQGELKKENWKDWINEEVIAKKELDIAENAAKIEEVRERIRNKEKPDKRIDPLKDPLQAIGNFLGSDPNSAVIKQMTDQTRELREIKRILNTTSTNSIFPL